MPTKFETNSYDLHWLFEAGYDEAPKIYAFQVWRNEEGYLECDSSHGIDDRYDYTEEDIAWTLANVKMSDDLAYSDLSEFYVDEWYSSEDKENLSPYLPPKALEWIENLATYETEDYSTKEAN